MLRTVIVSRIAKVVFQDAAERKNTIAGIQKIIRCSLTEFDKGAEEYKIFRETHDAPDWGVVRMSSIAMAHGRIQESELFLKEQMEEYGGEARRQARNVNVTDEQICAAIERVLKNDKTMESAFQFYDFLRKYKFCALRDVFVRILIEFTVGKFGWNAGLERLNKLIKDERRAKSMKMSVFFILENAWKAGDYEKAESLISNMEIVKPSTLRSLLLFIRLNEQPYLEAADYCRRNSISLNHEDVIYLVDLAGKLKYPMPLLRLLEINQFVPIPTSSIFSVLDELVKLAGKSGNAENLEGIMWKVKSNREVTDHERSILYGKIRHFYKCLNVKAPKKLHYLMIENQNL